ncbi:hypothetical protein DFR64_2096 [Pelolinea submarina]|uniref:Uncharacterized protein n=1 Tax=Pelolinea submarina TaxID=913107 RepID=A0A3E0ABP1_9CHLR|nr:hypothetical protein DFR64_2096 [Pelolinea submarina]
MQFIRPVTNYLKNQKHKTLSLLIASAGGLLFYISFFQRNFFSKTYLLYTLLVFIGLFFVSLKSNQFIKEKLIGRFPASDFRLCLFSAFLLSLLLALNFSPIPLYVLMKDKTLQIEVPVSASSNHDPIGLLYLRNQLGYIPYSELRIPGTWREEADHLLLENEGGTLLSWSGDLDELLEIAFQPSASPQMINVVVNGTIHEINLHENSMDGYVVFRYEGKPPLFSQIPFVFSFIILSTYLLLNLFTLLCSYRIKTANENAPRRNDFLLGIPLLVTSGLVLLTFWPGMMTNDSINQWKEVVTGNYTDLNPILHTLLLSGLVKIAYSPAVVAIFQIAVFYLVLVFGFGTLRRRGVSTPFLVVLSLIFALWPFNSLMVNILWKDILYSLALLLLFIFLLEAAWTNGNLLENKKNYLLLGITAFMVATIRHNGFPVAFIVLGILPLVYKKYWKGLLVTLLFVLLVWAGVKGPLKSRVSTTENNTNALNLTLLHHISAHFDAGSELTEDQIDYLNELLPISQWKYDCCYMGNIYTHPDFDQTLYMDNSSNNLRMAYALFLQDPAVDIKDQLCASEMDWRFVNNQCTLKSLHPFDIQDGKITGWIPQNSFGLVENSLLPQFIPAYYAVLERIGVFSGILTPLLRPAFYLFFALIVLMSASIRLKNKKILIAGLPIVLQTGILALINFAPAFRYQYGICLVGLFCIGLLFLPQGK